jgi:beta-lactamase superfamily II metal-dependent hydrolase
MAHIDGIKIRMYRHGFGDCFLVRFLKGNNVAFKMLIDCGLKHNDSVEGVSIKNVVDDISKEVGIKKGTKTIPHLDALVVTHEHWDHVSAFKPEKKLFDNFDIDNIWMGWTENPKDKTALQINANLKNNTTALAIATKKLSASTKKKKVAGFYNTAFNGSTLLGMRESFNAALQGMVDFYGPLSISKTTKSGIVIKDNYAISIETQKAFDHIKTKLAKNKSAIKYFNPGEIIENKEDLPGIRIYVLGPPKNELLNKDTPSSGAAKEVYFNLSNASSTGFVKGVLKSAGIDQGFDDGSPFCDADAAFEKDAKQQQYYKSTYYNKDEDWRSIDEDWLDMAGSLALQMDNDTNNTSLVLAIEFIATGKVLLFPGDAQVGNWLSWHDHTWKVKDGTKTKEVTATDLLANTVFYKAGHHASHNATLKDLGLELMKNEDELVVFVPEKEKQYSGIPHPELVERLNEKAQGRVIFSADSDYPPQDTLKTKPDGVTKKAWKAFTDNITLTNEYIEYTIR